LIKTNKTERFTRHWNRCNHRVTGTFKHSNGKYFWEWQWNWGNRHSKCCDAIPAVMDLCIGHGLGLHYFGAPRNSFLWLNIWKTENRHNFTIYYETSKHVNVKTLISTVTTW